jgi:hypothetical protein
MLLAWSEHAWYFFKQKDHRMTYPNPHVDEAKAWNEGFVEVFITDHIDHFPQAVQRDGIAVIR